MKGMALLKDVRRAAETQGISEEDLGPQRELSLSCPHLRPSCCSLVSVKFILGFKALAHTQSWKRMISNSSVAPGVLWIQRGLTAPGRPRSDI